MATWNSYVLTEAGEALMAEAIAKSKGITVTKIKTSAHDYTSTALETLTDLADIKQEFKPDSITVTDATTRISVGINNLALEAAYELNTIGVYANNGGEDVLFCVATASEAETMPVYTGGVIKEINAKIYITF